MGQSAEVMPRPLNLSLVISSLEVRTIFSLFVLKKHMLGFAQIISVFRTGWRFARVGVGYPVSGTCSRSSFCKWRTGNRFYRRLTSPSASIMAQNIQLFGPRGGFLTHQWIIT